MVRAYVLISTEPGAARDVFEKVKNIDGVVAYPVAGQYDIVAEVNVDSLEKITRIVFVDIRGIRGVMNTVTLIVVPSTAL